MAETYFQMTGKGLWEGNTHSLKGYNFPAKLDKSFNNVRRVIWFSIATCLRGPEAEDLVHIELSVSQHIISLADTFKFVENTIYLSFSIQF